MDRFGSTGRVRLRGFGLCRAGRGQERQSWSAVLRPGRAALGEARFGSSGGIGLGELGMGLAWQYRIAGECQRSVRPGTVCIGKAVVDS